MVEIKTQYYSFNLLNPSRLSKVQFIEKLYSDSSDYIIRSWFFRLNGQEFIFETQQQSEESFASIVDQFEKSGYQYSIED